MISLRLLLFVIVMLIISGCSSHHSNPTIPAGSNNGSSMPLPKSESNSERELLGSWTVDFDLHALKATAVPTRLANAHYNVTTMLPPPELNVNSYNIATNVVDVDVTLQNTFPVDGYDIRLIVFFDDAWIKLLNPDAWTDLYDVPGGLIINPFVAYNKQTNKRIFYHGYKYTENLQIYLHQGNTHVTFAVDASYPGNCEGPYEFQNFSQNKLYENVGSSTAVVVDVLDWQDDVDAVYLRCPEITGQPIVQFSHVDSTRWKLNIVNNTGIRNGEYVAYIKATSSNSGSLALYNEVYITVSYGTGTPDTDPPHWDSTTGIARAVPLIGSVNVFWGSATDTQSPPVEYLIYKDEDNFPWDQTPIVKVDTNPLLFTGLQNGRTYWFGVRCRDSAIPPNIDPNIVVLSATPQETIPSNPQIAGSCDYSFRPSLIKFSGDYAYTVSNYAAFAIFDISNMEEPEELSRIAITPGYYSDSGVVITDDFAYLSGRDYAVDTAHLIIINILNPSAPFILGSLDFPGWGWTHLSIVGNIACLTGHTNSINYCALIDISNPGAPEIVSSMNPPNSGVVVQDHYAFYNDFQGLKTFDIADPANPVLVNTFYYDGNYDPGIIEIIPGYIITRYSECRFTYIWFIDIRDPLNPEIADHLSFWSATQHDCIGVSGPFLTPDRMCLIIDDNGSTDYVIFDISDPYNIQYIGYRYWAIWTPVYNYNNYLYAFSPTEGLSIYEATNPSSPIFIRNFSGIIPDSVDIKGSYAFSGIKNHDSIAVYDISNPANPHMVKSYSLGINWISSSNDVAIAGDHMFVADGTSGLKVLDISNPIDPQLINTLSISGDLQKIVTSGSYVYIASTGYGFVVVDISNPNNPVEVGFLAYSEVRDMAVQGSYAYITEHQTIESPFHVVDISNPANPNTVGNISFGNFDLVAAQGNYAYSSQNWDLSVIDVSVPSNPHVVSQFEPEIYGSLNVSWNYAYIGSYGYLKIADMSDPINPLIISNLGNLSYITDISLVNNYAYLATDYVGIVTVKLW